MKNCHTLSYISYIHLQCTSKQCYCSRSLFKLQYIWMLKQDITEGTQCSIIIHMHSWWIWLRENIFSQLYVVCLIHVQCQLLHAPACVHVDSLMVNSPLGPKQSPASRPMDFEPKVVGGGTWLHGGVIVVGMMLLPMAIMGARRRLYIPAVATRVM